VLHKMFARQNFLKQSCSKFHKEQKLFDGHLMEMTTSCSKVAHKADLGLFPTLRIFSKSWIASVCSRVVWTASSLESRPNQVLIL